ncbi:hypothetical protein BDN72DRAFT_864457 [Pluteus cervinus]|uniref:Uncharacterized protein n=1 Tax=Pluteus cervinus TaxID=181527 RepID=A0ACD3A672_9AGAR|nr:hypothetical protein BDN72DRAFT_864457 [Pluteus cervinus]
MWLGWAGPASRAQAASPPTKFLNIIAHHGSPALLRLLELSRAENRAEPREASRGSAQPATASLGRIGCWFFKRVLGLQSTMSSLDLGHTEPRRRQYDDSERYRMERSLSGLFTLGRAEAEAGKVFRIVVVENLLSATRSVLGERIAVQGGAPRHGSGPLILDSFVFVFCVLVASFRKLFPHCGVNLMISSIIHELDPIPLDTLICYEVCIAHRTAVYTASSIPLPSGNARVNHETIPHSNPKRNRTGTARAEQVHWYQLPEEVIGKFRLLFLKSSSHPGHVGGVPPTANDHTVNLKAETEHATKRDVIDIHHFRPGFLHHVPAEIQFRDLPQVRLVTCFNGTGIVFGGMHLTWSSHSSTHIGLVLLGLASIVIVAVPFLMGWDFYSQTWVESGLVHWTWRNALEKVFEGMKIVRFGLYHSDPILYILACPLRLIDLIVQALFALHDLPPQHIPNPRINTIFFQFLTITSCLRCNLPIPHKTPYRVESNIEIVDVGCEGFKGAGSTYRRSRVAAW